MWNKVAVNSREDLVSMRLRAQIMLAVSVFLHLSTLLSFSDIFFVLRKYSPQNGKMADSDSRSLSSLSVTLVERRLLYQKV